MARLYSTACERNRQPILASLRTTLPEAGTLLEVAAGTGMHAAFMAPRLPHLTWQPTDADADALASIDAWRETVEAPNLRPALRLDVCDSEWPLDTAAAIFNANMVHISPWACTLGLLDGAARLLTADAPLVLYGPFRREGTPTAPSNERFDESLRARDPSWGLRQLEAVEASALERGFRLESVSEMPANNLTVVFRR